MTQCYVQIAFFPSRHKDPGCYDLHVQIVMSRSQCSGRNVQNVMSRSQRSSHNVHIVVFREKCTDRYVTIVKSWIGTTILLPISSMMGTTIYSLCFMALLLYFLLYYLEFKFLNHCFALSDSSLLLNPLLILNLFLV